jgi:hypothetical protein
MNRLEGLRAQWEALNEREKTLVRALGVVALACLVLLPVYLLSAAIGDLEAQNGEIAEVLGEINRAGDRLAQRRAERERAEARYAQRAPELGTFLEGRASGQHLSISSVTNQPEVQEGSYRRRHVRASFPSAPLRKAVHLLTDIESAPQPIALERIYIDHQQAGDTYNLELGVITYDRQRGNGTDAGVAQSREGATSGGGN